MLHIYTEKFQPATRWIDPHMNKHRVIEWPAGRLVRCQCCGEMRRAGNAVVQCYYDALMFWCAGGMGCKSGKVIAAKKRREFRNRSKAQKARWAKASNVGNEGPPQAVPLD